MVSEGLVRGIGLSEISAADIRKAHAIHPITAVELEWSLFTRDAEVLVLAMYCAFRCQFSASAAVAAPAAHWCCCRQCCSCSCRQCRQHSYVERHVSSNQQHAGPHTMTLSLCPGHCLIYTTSGDDSLLDCTLRFLATGG